MSHASGSLPTSGTAVELEWDGGLAKLSVDGADSDELVLTDVTGRVPDVAVDTSVVVRWRGQHGMWWLPGVVSCRRDDIDGVGVRPTGQAECRQRRQFFRLGVSLPVSVRHAGRPLDAHMRNLSETGMRLFLGPNTKLEVGDEVEVTFTPEDQEISCGATVRNRLFDGDGLTVGVQLVGLDETAAQSIRRRLLHEQIAQRSRARWDGDDLDASAKPRPRPVATENTGQRGGLLKRLFA